MFFGGKKHDLLNLRARRAVGNHDRPRNWFLPLRFLEGLRVPRGADAVQVLAGEVAMPISVENKGRYPKDWKRISAAIRERSGGRCECEGECGLHRTHPGPRRCVERHGEPAKWAKGKIVLTCAHLNHEPEDCRPENLKAMCQRCHLRYDHKLHMQNAYQTRRKGKAAGDLFSPVRWAAK